MQTQRLKLRKKGGIVGDIVEGAGGLIILVIITLIVLGTLIGANLLKGGVATTTVLNESVLLNSSAGIEQLDYYNPEWHDYTILLVRNETGDQLIPEANYTFFNGKLTNATEYNFYVNVSYSYVGLNQYEDSVVGMKENFTSGLQNVSTKLPTILLIAAVVLLFSVLVLLIARSKQMGAQSSSGTL